jgi:hypothetical protein
VWDLKAKKEIGYATQFQPETEKTYVRQEFRGCGRFLQSVEREWNVGVKAFTLTDPTTRKTTASIKLRKYDSLLDLSPDGKTVLIVDFGAPFAAGPFEVRLLDVVTGKERRFPKGHEPHVRAGAFSPDGMLIATASARPSTGSGPTEVVIWDAAALRPVTVLQDKEKSLDFQRIGFSSDGRYVWAQSNDKEMRLWGQLPAPLPGAVPPLAVEATDRIDALVKDLAAGNRPADQTLEFLFVALLGRFPTEYEKRITLDKSERKLTAPKLKEIAAALMATKEFAAHVAELQKPAAGKKR